MDRKSEILANVADILKGIAEECKLLSKQSFQEHGINDKVGEDTLTDSNIYKSLETRYNEDGLIEILVNGYIENIQGGRKPNEPFPWKLAVEVLAEWCERKLHKSDNTTIYFVWKSIVEEGIKPRPIFDIPEGLWTTPSNTDGLVMDLVDEYWDDWADELFEACTMSLDDYFND